MNLIYIALGGALGALARYGTAQLAQLWWHENAPIGTWIVNLLGCFLIGLALPQFAETPLAPSLRLFFVTGFLGAYTTFSTFSFETLYLVHRGEWGMALFNIAGSVLLGLLMTALGIWMGKS